MRVKIVSPAPILNTPDFSAVFGGKSGHEIPLNDRGLPHYYEFVALEGMIFEALELCSPFIYHVKQAHYPSQNLYLDSRFFRPTEEIYSPSLPAKEIILERMLRRVGTPYVWGGNWGDGIPELLTLYPPRKPLDEKTEILWTWRGLDCSGLLFEATRGATPRNTSELVFFGDPLTLTNQHDGWKSLQPLDMIVYPGHVLFVCDPHTAIESRSPYGVILTPLKKRWEELSTQRKLVDTWHPSLDPARHFLIRRIHREIVEKTTPNGE